MDPLHILELLVKKHYKTHELSLEEARELENALANSEEARQMEADILSVSPEDARRFMRKVDVDSMHTQVIQGAAFAKRKRRQQRYWLAAALAIGVFIITGSIFLRQDTPNSSSLSTSSEPETGATLVLASGEIIQLKDSGFQAIGGMANMNRSITIPAMMSGSNTGNIAYNLIHVPNRLDYKINLPDGSIVWLNSATKFRFPMVFTGTERKVYVDEGEAYFDIAKQTAPFVVHTSNSVIQVLGTEFNVNTYDSNATVTSLVAGRVALSAGQIKKELRPGEQGIVNGTGSPIVQQFEISTISWRQGIHYFQNVPVSEVAVILKRYFDVTLHIDDPYISTVRFRCKIQRRLPVQHFIDDVNRMGEVTLYWKGNELHCKKNLAELPQLPS